MENDKNRNHFILKSIILAIEEMKAYNQHLMRNRVITLAKQYGGSLKITRKEVEEVLKMTVSETFGIKRF